MKRHQSGQALIAGLVMILSILTAALFSYQIGRIIKEKSRLMVASDAAGFSVAQEQASVMNTLSYLNRAQIAHQVALAHLVTLASAEKFRQNQSAQSLANNPPTALIGMLFGPHYAAAYVASNAGSAGGFWLPEQIRFAYRWHDHTVHELINRSQQAMLMNWEARRDRVFEEALAKNLRAYNFRLVDSSITMPMIIDSNNAGAYLKRLAVQWSVLEDQTKQKVVMQNGDDDWMRMLEAVVKTQFYLEDRNYTVKNKWAIHPRCPWRRHVLRRNGETRMTESGIWRAEDTLSFHAVRSNKWIGCYMREYPMGWSLVNPLLKRARSTDAPRNFSKEAYWKWLSKHEGSTRALKSYGVNRLAKAWSSMDSVHLGGKGQGSHASLKSDASRPKNRSIAIKYKVAKMISPFPFGNGMASGIAVGLAKDKYRDPKGITGLTRMRISTTTASEAFFAYPGTNGMENELVASIFKPYWQGRISVTP